MLLMEAEKVLLETGLHEVINSSARSTLVEKKKADEGGEKFFWRSP
jgi:hypothetical protein